MEFKGHLDTETQGLNFGWSCVLDLIPEGPFQLEMFCGYDFMISAFAIILPKRLLWKLSNHGIRGTTLLVMKNSK